MYTEAWKWILIEQKAQHGIYIFYPLKIKVRVYFNSKTVRTFKSYIYILLTYREYNDKATSLEQIKGHEEDRTNKKSILQL